MSLKLSPGCECCDDEGCNFCTTTTPTEMDMTFAGFYNNDFAGGTCSDCDTAIDGTYSLAWDGDPTCQWTYRAADPPAGATATCESGDYYFWICHIRLWLTTATCTAGSSSNLNWKFSVQFNYEEISTGSRGVCNEAITATFLTGYDTIAALPHTFDCSAVSNFTIGNICGDPSPWNIYCWWDSTTLDVKVSAG